MKNIGVKHSLESIDKEIAKRCKGVPLAIRALAGILRGKDRESEWTEVFEGDFWKHDKAGNNSNIMSVLKLSYQNLSPRLKQCFAYCSIYPKDWNIKKTELIQLWMAQGYLECSNEKQCMEEVGNQFVKMLLMKSFFQDVVIDDHGHIYSFKMHDLMHDLALLVASKDYCHLDFEKRNVERLQPMYVSLEYEAIQLADSIDGSRLRTFFLRGYEERLRFEGRWSTVFSFERLRVLRISSGLIKNLPNSIDKLKHLRYLDLCFCGYLLSLPKSIGNLVNLQTLKLNYCFKLDKISVQVVTKLINLRHLEIDGCEAFEETMPVGLGKLSSLQTLSKFVVGDAKEAAKLNELKDLNSLRGKLEIEWLGNVREVRSESQEVNLKEKKNLEFLKLNWGYNFNNNDSLQLLDNLQPHQHLKRLTVWNYPGVKFSNWISSLTNVSHIYVNGFDNCRYLPPLEHLPSLKSLIMERMHELEHICMKKVSPSEEGTFFPSLKTLAFHGCRKLRGWKRMGEDDASVPLESLPEGMPRLTNLHTLKVTECPHLLERCKRDAGVDWPKIAHVPNIILEDRAWWPLCYDNEKNRKALF